MRAVWSFWTRPFDEHYGGIWSKPLHHLLSWGLSLQTAAQHYSDTVLVTDRRGKELLVDQLGLEFGTVSMELERLKDADAGLWALGKLVAYALQDRPFLHLDSDVFLWKRLPAWLEEAPVFTQCPEPFSGHYYPQDIEWAFTQAKRPLPIEWTWARAHRGFFPCETCGIFGGNDIGFIRHYAQTAVSLALAPQNAAAWALLGDKRGYNIVLEQLFLAACAEFHMTDPASLFRGVHIAHLFSSWQDSMDANQAARRGFTHLISHAKSHPAVGRRIEERVRRENPHFLRHCEQIAARASL